MLNYKELVPGVVLTATPTSYYTAPAQTQAAINAASVTNPTGAAVTVNLYRVLTAGSASSTLKIASRVVAPGATVTMYDAINHKLAPGSQLFADGLGCGLVVSGVEYIPGT